MERDACRPVRAALTVASMVRYGQDENSARGLLSEPSGTAPRPSVVLTTAIAGGNAYVGQVLDRLAAAGYTAASIDYYARGGQPPDLSNASEVMSAVENLNDTDVLADVAATASWLRARPQSNGNAAILGFCIGGSYALLAASQIDGLACAVAFYGMLRFPWQGPRKPVSPIDAATKGVRCPFLGHFGEVDHLVPVEQARELGVVLAGHPAEIYIYPGAGHAFHEDFRPQVYRPVAAEAAWRRTLTYLGHYLGAATGL